MTAENQPVIIGGRYQLTSRLGHGGMGIVYQAQDLLNAEQVALKRVTVPTEHLMFSTMSDISSPAYALASEFTTLAALRHPHIISVLDFGFSDDGQPYFVMELLEDAQTLVEAGNGQSFEQQIDLLIQTLQALIYLHRRGVIHRDLKPGNIMVHSSQVKVVDFGLSVVTNRSVVGATHQTAGTFAYIPPEVFNGESASRSGDLYALGMIAYEMISGQYPFDTSNIAVLLSQIVSFEPDWVSFIDQPDLQVVLARLLAKDRQDRYSDPAEVLRDLCAAIGRPLPPESIEIRESYLQTAGFVGRQQEVDQLTEALTDALNGTGSGWLVGGESGVGKSRLLSEIRIIALVKGAVVVRGRGAEGSSLPYQYWRPAVSELVLHVAVDDQEAAILKEVVPDIANLLGRLVADAPLLDGQAQQQRLSLTIHELFVRLERPILLILEDLQWARRSLPPLVHLLSGIEHLPILILGDYRNDEHPGLPEELPQMQSINLPRFSMGEVEALSTAMLGDAGRTRSLVDLLFSETEGNIYFMIEALRALVEDLPSLSEIGQSPLPQQIIAQGIENVLRRRLQKVPDWGQELLQLVALAGRQLDLAVIELLADTYLFDRSVETWLTSGNEAMVLEVVDEVWQFNHDKLRQQLRADLPPAKQTEYYYPVAEAYEQCYADDSNYAGILADLWQGAGQPEKELIYAFEAGIKADQQGDYLQARRYLDRALELLPTDDIEARWKILKQRGTALNLLGEAEAYQHDLDLMLALAEQQGNDLKLSEVYARLGMLTAHHGDEQGAIDFYDKSLAYAGNTDDSSILVPLLCSRLVSQIRRRLLDDAQQTAAQILPLLDQLPDGDLRNQAYTDLSLYFSEVGDISQAAQLMQKQADLNRRTGSVYAETIGLSNLGYNYVLLGQYDQAQQTLERAVMLSKKIRSPRVIGYCGLNLGLAEIKLTETHKALATLAMAVAELEMVEDAFGIAASNTYRGLAFEQIERYADAQQHYAAAMKTMNEIGAKGFATDTQAGVARCQLADDQILAAQSSIELVWQFLQENQGVGAEFPSIGFLSCYDVFMASDKQDQARQAIEAGHQALMTNAEKISDADWRVSYLEQVPENHRLVKLFKSL